MANSVLTKFKNLIQFLIYREDKSSPAFEKFYKIATSYYIFILVVAFCVFSYLYLDRPISFYMLRMVTGYLINVANIITEFGVSSYYLVIFAILFLLFRLVWRKPKIANIFVFLFLSVGISGLICDSLKIVAGRYRPSLYLGRNLYGFSFFKLHANTWSFPSGHSVTISAIAVALILLFPRLWYLFISMIVLVCLSRLMLYAHFLSDVVFGAYIGSVTTLVVFKKLKVKV